MPLAVSIVIVIGLALGATTACSVMDDRRDYERHTMSHLQQDWQRPDILLFEASSSTNYPADSDSAEAVRMDWLSAWMKRGNHCPHGWEVVSRTEIPPRELRARRHDVRYEVKCAEASKPARRHTAES